METLSNKRTSRTMTFSVPAKDCAFLRRLSHNMGWVEIPQPRKRKTGIELALEDVKAGRVYKADSIEDLFNQLNAE